MGDHDNTGHEHSRTSVHRRKRNRLDCDVIVAGGGPSGAATAIHLARAGFGVILIDSQVFPRDKVCGDFVSPVALRELHALGIADLPEYKRSHVIRDAAVHLDGELMISSVIHRVAGLPAHGRVIPRKALDDWILARARAAGAQVWEGCRVTAFQTCPGHVRVSVHCKEGFRILRAKVLVGADGSSSLISRILRGNSVCEDDRIIAVRGYFEGINGPSERADIYFSSKSFPGYCWLFPTSKTGANVGVGMVLKTVPPSNDHLPRLLLQLIQQDRALRKRLSRAQQVGRIVGWPLTTYNAQHPIVSDRVLLVGDAAGLINPLNGEGIQYALLSGGWASETVKNCAAQGDFSRAALQGYATRVADELHFDMAVSRSIVQLIRNRNLNRVWLEALRIITARASVDPEYAAITGGVLAGLIPVRRITNLNVIRKSLEQAALSLGFQAVKEALRGPNHLQQLGVALSGAAVDIAKMMVQNRAESVEWGLGLAKSALELTGEASNHAAASSKSTRSVSRPGKSRRAVKRR
jgi:geranylgeranyl reductase family protein